MKTLIIIPTYNEAENIQEFLHLVFQHVPEGAHVLVVDDNSPDGTSSLVRATAKEFPDRLFLLQRKGKLGLGTAYVAGFKWGLSKDYEAFCEMDADFSHNPVYLPPMMGLLTSSDVVVGSRNVEGGGVSGWGIVRNFISKGGSFYARVILSMPVRDMTGGFNLWRREVLESIGLDGIQSEGYAFQIELKYRAHKKGFCIKEYPILFEDRSQGTSKMSKRIFLEAMYRVWQLRFSRR